MKHSDSLAQIGAALAVAQGQIQGAKKDSSNPFFGSKYADLAAVWEVIRKPLSDNNLAVVQTVRVEHARSENKDVQVLANAIGDMAGPPAVIVTTLLIHSSGEWISEETTMWPKDGGPQAIGTCTSYARRYALAAMVGVYQVDDDAEAATDHEQEHEVNTLLDETVIALKTADAMKIRQIWNDLNAVGNTQAIWKALNTKQKNLARELLQQTAPVAAQPQPQEQTP